MRIGLGMSLVLLAISSPRASAQPITNLEGIVEDRNGGIARARVTAIDTLTNERRTALTNERGFYRMLDLTPGRYSVSAKIVGHVSVTQEVRLAAGERSQLDFLLERAPDLLDAVVVKERRADAAVIERMSVSTAVSDHEIQRLPLSRRNVMDLAALAPGVRSFQSVDGHALPVAGAMRHERGINLYLDGVEMKNMNTGNVVGSPQVGSPLPADGLSELRVYLNPYDAEYTRGVSYVISAVSHRGTNERHGSGFFLFQNRDLISTTDFQRRIPNFSKPDFSRRQLGFSMRGPVIRDRLFYAATYELSDTENYFAVVPGQPANSPAFWDGYAGVFKAPNRNQTALFRLTYAADDRNLLEAIWSSRHMTGESEFGGTVTHDARVAQNYGVNTVNLRHRWLPSPNAANELSLQFVGWSSENNSVVRSAEMRYPTLSIGRANGTFHIFEKHFRAVERFTYSLGRGPGSHLLKSGIEASRVITDQFTPNGRDGSFRFRSETGEPFEGLIAVGLMHPESDRDARTEIDGWVVGAYINDEWQVSRRLTLNLGLRYDADVNTQNNDFVSPWLADSALSARPELRGLLSSGNRKSDLDNLSPRISFSWDLAGNRRTFARAGFAIMYDRSLGATFGGEERAAAWRTYTFANPGTLDAAELRRRVIAGGGTPVPPMINLVPEDLDVPQNRQWSIGFGAHMTPRLALNLDYLDQEIKNLFASVNLNWLDMSQTPARRALSSSHGNIIALGDFARARFRALLTRLSYTPNADVRLNLSHTLASARADWDLENAQPPARTAGEFYVLQRISGDERHRFVLSGTWELPFGVDISTIATAASPRPYKTVVGQDLNKNNFQEDDWIDGKRYRIPENAWRNWYRVVDMRLKKAIRIRQHASVSVIVEAFNIFNTENYSGYFGVQRNATGELRSDFGSPSGTVATRQFQIGTKLEF
ncbi:MAG TPA: TonB-dependent receptor [Gemmatimonadaceae bacterium]